MTSISNADCLISAIYDAVLEPDLWPEVLARLGAHVGVDGVVFGTVSLERLWEGEFWSHGIGPEAVAALSHRGIMGQSVYANALRVLPLDRPARLAAFSSERLYREDVGAQAILAPQNFRDGLFGPVGREEGALVPIACLREGRRGALDPGAADRLAVLAPHLRRAMALHRRHRALEADRALVAAALEPLALGVLAVEADLRVRFANPEAERILRQADGLALRHGRLALADRAQETALCDGAARMALREFDGEAQYLFVPRPSGAPPYTLCIGPAGTSTGVPRGAATLYLTDPAGPATLPPPELLAARFALTAAEAEVARLAALGQGMGYVAARLGVSINTARTHIKAVYGKTGAGSQAGLGRLIAAGFPPVRGTLARQDGARR
jgi:DNA-binding CsgD family transcriptional regulator/PAS domain-containing protein